jgi:ribose transport system permease protein
MMKADVRILLSEYGNVLVLLLLCIVVSVVTLKRQSATSSVAAKELSLEVAKENPKGAKVLVLVRIGDGASRFAQALEDGLSAAGLQVVGSVVGIPSEVRSRLLSQKEDLVAVVTGEHMGDYCTKHLAGLATQNEALVQTKSYQTETYLWPDFLKKGNLLNVLKQVSVVAIIAIGMTLVIITAGIDLSVGSLIAFSGVVAALVIQSLGGDTPSSSDLWLGSLVGISVCALIGMGTGGLVTAFRIPPFIVTLGVMFIAKGLAFIFSKSEPIPVENDGFDWLGRGSDLFGLPNSVSLMIFLFVVAHVVMSRTSLGRYVYAVGGNPEAARLSGVPVKWVLVFVYMLCGLLAGLGGVMEASLHLTGDPKSGTLVELQVIAAVVVGGTSLAGGQGKIFGTLIGALIIGVIRNGMNLTGVEAHMQSVVYGVVILIAVLVDQLKGRLR